jgi:hypothetical protein
MRGKARLKFSVAVHLKVASMKYFLLLFLLTAFLSGVWAVLRPDSVVSFRRRMNWPESLLTGGFFYATALRTRVTGAVVLLVSSIGIIQFLSS